MVPCMGVIEAGRGSSSDWELVQDGWVISFCKWHIWLVSSARDGAIPRKSNNYCITASTAVEQLESCEVHCHIATLYVPPHMMSHLCTCLS